jgi:DNA-binding GntR family transcriptional regulator
MKKIVLKIERPSLRTEIVARILEAVFAGTIAPGSSIRERQLSAELGVSRTPLREALLELAFHGIVNLQSHRGAKFEHFGTTELREIYHIRAILESECARLATPLLDKGKIEAQSKLMEQQLSTYSSEGKSKWSSRSIKLDEDFHELLRASCNNSRLQNEIGRYMALSYAIRRSLGTKYKTQERALHEHIEILNAMQQGDAVGAAEAMRAHIQNAADTAVGFMFKS